MSKSTLSQSAIQEAQQFKRTPLMTKDLKQHFERNATSLATLHSVLESRHEMPSDVHYAFCKMLTYIYADYLEEQGVHCYGRSSGSESTNATGKEEEADQQDHQQRVRMVVEAGNEELYRPDNEAEVLEHLTLMLRAIFTMSKAKLGHVLDALSPANSLTLPQRLQKMRPHLRAYHTGTLREKATLKKECAGGGDEDLQDDEEDDVPSSRRSTEAQSTSGLTTTEGHGTRFMVRWEEYTAEASRPGFPSPDLARPSKAASHHLRALTAGGDATNKSTATKIQDLILVIEMTKGRVLQNLPAPVAATSAGGKSKKSTTAKKVTSKTKVLPVAGELDDMPEAQGRLLLAQQLEELTMLNARYQQETLDLCGVESIDELKE